MNKLWKQIFGPLLEPKIRSKKVALVYNKDTGRLSEYEDEEILNSFSSDDTIPF